MDSLQDARNLGLCLTFKHYVQTLQCATAYLLSDLHDHHRELSLERVHSFLTARRHRRAIDETVQRFVRMSSQIPAKESLPGSIRMQTRARIVDFIDCLRSLLPAVEYSRDDRGIDVSSEPTVDWGVRLRDTAVQIEKLILDLQPLRVQLDTVLSEKSRISSEIDSALQSLAGTL